MFDLGGVPPGAAIADVARACPRTPMPSRLSAVGKLARKALARSQQEVHLQRLARLRCGEVADRATRYVSATEWHPESKSTTPSGTLAKSESVPDMCSTSRVPGVPSARRAEARLETLERCSRPSLPDAVERTAHIVSPRTQRTKSASEAMGSG